MRVQRAGTPNRAPCASGFLGHAEKSEGRAASKSEKHPLRAPKSFRRCRTREPDSPEETSHGSSISASHNLAARIRHGAVLLMVRESLRTRRGNLRHVCLGLRRAVNTINEFWEIKRLLNFPNGIMFIGRQNMRRVPNCNPSNRYD